MPAIKILALDFSVIFDMIFRDLKKSNFCTLIEEDVKEKKKKEKERKN